MPFRTGDTVSMTLAPPLQLARYLIFKTSVTLTRELNDDPDADLEDMKRTLRSLYYSRLHDEITLHGELTELLTDGSVKDLANYALRQSSTHVRKTTRKKKHRQEEV